VYKRQEIHILQLLIATTGEHLPIFP